VVYEKASGSHVTLTGLQTSNSDFSPSQHSSLALSRQCEAEGTKIVLVTPEEWLSVEHLPSMYEVLISF
jgi:hypothetical protein